MVEAFSLLGKGLFLCGLLLWGDCRIELVDRLAYPVSSIEKALRLSAKDLD